LTPVSITAASLVCAAGTGLDAVARALKAERTGLRANDLDWVGYETWIGRVEGVEDHRVRGDLAEYDCRNNRLAEMGLETDGFAPAVARAAARYGAHRVAVILGTSTSGIQSTETAYREIDPQSGALPDWFHLEKTHAYFSLADFVRRRLRLRGPAHVVATACSSSSKTFVDAEQMMRMGLCDAAVVGGVDTLCRLTIHGFASLSLLDRAACKPNDLHRAGINIGEAAGFALLERRESPAGGAPFATVLGCGESSDAYHMSSPDPDGQGAEAAMRAALRESGLAPGAIDYINLHGTGTIINDKVENVAVQRVFGSATPASSTKAWTGHTLGASGILGVLLACLAIRDGSAPKNLNLETPDPSLGAPVLAHRVEKPIRHALANAFGFGGTNCSIVVGAAA
jgi:3-oxoacyl-[acyl-carrier-protein] synthase-1